MFQNSFHISFFLSVKGTIAGIISISMHKYIRISTCTWTPTKRRRQKTGDDALPLSSSLRVFFLCRCHAGSTVVAGDLSAHTVAEASLHVTGHQPGNSQQNKRNTSTISSLIGCAGLSGATGAVCGKDHRVPTVTDHDKSNIAECSDEARLRVLSAKHQGTREFWVGGQFFVACLPCWTVFAHTHPCFGGSSDGRENGRKSKLQELLWPLSFVPVSRLSSLQTHSACFAIVFDSCLHAMVEVDLSSQSSQGRDPRRVQVYMTREKSPQSSQGADPLGVKVAMTRARKDGISQVSQQDRVVLQPRWSSSTRTPM